MGRIKLFIVKAWMAGFFIFLLTGSNEAFANNLVIANAELVNPDSVSETIKIQFDISWDNSWRNNTCRDAVWVFCKYTADQGQTWHHAILKASGKNPPGFSIGTGNLVADVIVPADRVGGFIERRANGNGPVSLTGVQLLWDYKANKLTKDMKVRVKVFGMEMVYVPTGSFFAGDGSGVEESTFALHVADNTAVFVSASSVNNVTVDANGNDDIDSTPLSISGEEGISGNPKWPTGYKAFYMSKYEVTEGQWVDFFNTLTPTQKINRDITGMAGKNSQTVVDRNTLSWAGGEANAMSLRPDRPCGFLSWMDGCAYADWAGLRPMTELEYEKAARGSASTYPGQYVWGSIDAVAAGALNGQEDGTETVGTSKANANYNNMAFSGGDGGSGPLRAGIFATASSTRQKAGAGYYGTMELSGNLAERCVTIGNAQGRIFMGSHGDGELTMTSGFEGNAENVDWPGMDETAGRGVTGAFGSGIRGGSFSDTIAEKLRISDRSEAGVISSGRESRYGFRPVRSAE